MGGGVATGICKGKEKGGGSLKPVFFEIFLTLLDLPAFTVQFSWILDLSNHRPGHSLEKHEFTQEYDHRYEILLNNFIQYQYHNRLTIVVVYLISSTYNCCNELHFAELSNDYKTLSNNFASVTK